MKKINKFVLLTVLSSMLGFTSCSYLDIVPDEQEKAEDAFEDLNALDRYLYSCYSYLPPCRSGTSSLDFFTGDEVVTAFEHETFARFPKGNYTASDPVISYWNDFFGGLRQCYMFLDGLAGVTNLPEKTKQDYIAQTKFLIAYYHYLLARCYGPIILVKETPSILTPPSDYLARTSYDECVDWICGMFDEAAAGLPQKRSAIKDYGLATSIAAKSLKAKLLLYAASPLFNGNSKFYSDFKNIDGTPLMPLTYDPNKWVKAKTAYQEAITAAEAAGYGLYEIADNANAGTANAFPEDPVQRCLRYNIIDKGNKEIIWADCRDEGNYGLQNKSLPYSSASAWNGTAPTLSMLNRFYTKNGLPLDEDPEFKDVVASPYELATIDEAHAEVAAVGEKTAVSNLNREPRYYAWVAFQGSFYEILSASTNGAYANDDSYNEYSEDGAGRLVCNFVLGGNCARGKVGALRANDYSPTGFLNKKGCDPGYAISTNLQGAPTYPWPLVRMAELYLGYAEACAETNDLANAKTYLNKIRTRAGIPTVEKSWEGVASLTQDKLRDIIRQERMIEFYLENQNFWDMRRWLLAEKYFNVKARGMNIEAPDLENFSQEKEVIFERKFTSPTQYLLPIPLSDVQKNENLVQNPGY